MYWPEALIPLCEALHDEAAALDALRQELTLKRSAFVAPHPRLVAAAADELTPLAEHAARCAERRARHTSAVCKALSLGEGANARQMIERLDAPEAHRLRGAAERARVAATHLHVENAVGADLLDLSARVQEGIWQRLIATGHSAPALYDARSHSVQTPAPRGNLVDGQV